MPKRSGYDLSGRCRGKRIALALCVVFSVSAGCQTPRSRPPCVAQPTAAMIEILRGQLDDCAPAVAAWEREQARACGWVLPEDFTDE